MSKNKEKEFNVGDQVLVWNPTNWEDYKGEIIAVVHYNVSPDSVLEETQYASKPRKFRHQSVNRVSYLVYDRNEGVVRRPLTNNIKRTKKAPVVSTSKVKEEKLRTYEAAPLFVDNKNYIKSIVKEALREVLGELFVGKA